MPLVLDGDEVVVVLVVLDLGQQGLDDVRPCDPLAELLGVAAGAGDPLPQGLARRPDVVLGDIPEVRELGVVGFRRLLGEPIGELTQAVLPHRSFSLSVVRRSTAIHSGPIDSASSSCTCFQTGSLRSRGFRPVFAWGVRMEYSRKFFFVTRRPPRGCTPHASGPSSASALTHISPSSSIPRSLPWIHWGFASSSAKSSFGVMPVLSEKTYGEGAIFWHPPRIGQEPRRVRTAAEPAPEWAGSWLPAHASAAAACHSSCVPFRIPVSLTA